MVHCCSLVIPTFNHIMAEGWWCPGSWGHQAITSNDIIDIIRPEIIYDVVAWEKKKLPCSVTILKNCIKSRNWNPPIHVKNLLHAILPVHEQRLFITLPAEICNTMGHSVDCFKRRLEKIPADHSTIPDMCHLKSDWKFWPTFRLTPSQSSHIAHPREWDMLSLFWFQSLVCDQPLLFLCCISYRWFSARLQYLQCISTGDTAVLHLSIDIMSYDWLFFAGYQWLYFVTCSFSRAAILLVWKRSS